jgi:hypothetical protein
MPTQHSVAYADFQPGLSAQVRDHGTRRYDIPIRGEGLKKSAHFTLMFIVLDIWTSEERSPSTGRTP